MASALGLLIPMSANAQVASLPVQVQVLLEKYQVPQSAVSAHVLDLGSNAVVLEHHASTARNPASVMKVLTTLAALEKLGPAFVWPTEYFLNGSLQNGVLNGDLVIKGHGDPFLVTERFYLHLRALRELGLKTIKGNLIIDNSAFKLKKHDPGAFDRSPYRLYNVGPSATVVNFNASRFKMVSDGKVVRILQDPPLHNVKIIDKMRLKKGGCRAKEHGWRMDTTRQNKRAEVTFTGTFSDGCKQHDYRRAVLSNNAYLFGLFTHLWAQVGGEFAGDYKRGQVSSAAELFYTGSGKNLAEVIIGTNKYSNNLLARQLLLTLSAQDNAQPAGTESHGAALIKTWLQRADINAPELQIENGSGLARNIRISSQSLNAILRHGWRSLYQPEFLSSFSLAGTDGTARKRFKQVENKGRIRIKTGYLRGTRSMAGYIKTRSGKMLAVNLLIEHPNINYSKGNQVQDAFIRALLGR